jgi:mannosyl-oligosaccharide alpha-1,2-mannosidase
MSPPLRRIVVLCVTATLLFFAFRQLSNHNEFPSTTYTSSSKIERAVKWKNVRLRNPVTSMIPLPTGEPKRIPKIQHSFGVETTHNKEQRLQRQAAVKAAFLHTWQGYKKYAWLQDEITPVTGGFNNAFGQRGATLVDTLDTLIIMGLKEEFEEAVKATKKIDFTTAAIQRLNVFETTIRFLGGLLAAGKHPSLLTQATDLGDMLYTAFDTPNRMPITRWNWEKCATPSSPGQTHADQKQWRVEWLPGSRSSSPQC